MTEVANPPRRVRRVALVGAGYFSRFHLEGWRTVPDVEIVAVCDQDARKAEQSARLYDVPMASDDVDRVLALPGLDLLDIVVPPASQETLIRKALHRNVVTVCQKPFATSYAQAMELTALAEQAGLPLVIHENFRFMPWYREIARLLNAGLLGPLHGIAFRFRPGDGQGPSAYMDRQPYFQKMPRFLIAETAIHFIDTFRFLCGEITAVTASLRRLNPAMAGEDAGHVIFEFEAGFSGLFDGNRLNDQVATDLRRTMGQLWIDGQNGVLRLDGDATLYFKPHRGGQIVLNYPRGDPELFGGGACGALQRDLVSHLSQGTSPENSARQYLRNLLIQEAIYSSHRQCCRIQIDRFHPPAIPVHPFD